MSTRRVYQRGRKSTSLKTFMVFDPVTQDWWAPWVLREEQDRREARARIPKAFANFKRLIASSRSS